MGYILWIWVIICYLHTIKGTRKIHWCYNGFDHFSSLGMITECLFGSSWLGFPFPAFDSDTNGVGGGHGFTEEFWTARLGFNEKIGEIRCDRWDVTLCKVILAQMGSSVAAHVSSAFRGWGSCYYQDFAVLMRTSRCIWWQYSEQKSHSLDTKLSKLIF